MGGERGEEGESNTAGLRSGASGGGGAECSKGRRCVGVASGHAAHSKSLWLGHGVSGPLNVAEGVGWVIDRASGLGGARMALSLQFTLCQSNVLV